MQFCLTTKIHPQRRLNVKWNFLKPSRFLKGGIDHGILLEEKNQHYFPLCRLKICT